MKTYLFLLLVSLTSLASAQNTVAVQIDKPVDCGSLQSETMTFLVDGSLQSAAVVKREVHKLKACGLDDYDIRFFGRIESLSTMLKKLTQDQLIDRLTYGDLLTGINDMKQTANYVQLKKLALISQQLAETRGNIRTWEKDKQLFNELGASQQIIDKVYRYLRKYPDNELTYQELLTKLKK